MRQLATDIGAVLIFDEVTTGFRMTDGGIHKLLGVNPDIAVFAKSWAKRFADTRSGYGMLAMRGIEAGAALVIIGFGVLLLTGYMVSERMVGL